MGGRGHVVLEGGVLRVVIEVHIDGRMAPGTLVVEIVDSHVKSTLGFLEPACKKCIGGVFVVHFLRGAGRGRR